MSISSELKPEISSVPTQPWSPNPSKNDRPAETKSLAPIILVCPQFRSAIKATSTDGLRYLTGKNRIGVDVDVPQTTVDVPLQSEPFSLSFSNRRDAKRFFSPARGRTNQNRALTNDTLSPRLQAHARRLVNLAVTDNHSHLGDGSDIRVEGYQLLAVIELNIDTFSESDIPSLIDQISELSNEFLLNHQKATGF